MREQWKDIEGYEGLYQVSNKGRVYSNKKTIIRSNGVPLNLKGMFIAQSLQDGYYRIRLSKKNKKGVSNVARLVGIAFIPNYDNKPQINHINGIKTDNNVNNLEWVSAKENMEHAFRIGLATPNVIPVLKKSITNDKLYLYRSVKEAATENNLDASTIVKCCKGTRKSTGGYKWEYA